MIQEREKNYKKALHEKYEIFRLEGDEERRKQLLIEMEAMVGDLDSPDSEDIYILGLGFYFLDENEEHNIVLASELFLKAYQLDSNNFLACLYAAHCFQDKGAFKEALVLYKKVDQKELKKFQIWRYVKLIEQIGFCYFKLGNKKNGREKFLKVLEWYKILEVNEMPFPLEMMECLDPSDAIVKEMNIYLNRK